MYAKKVLHFCDNFLRQSAPKRCRIFATAFFINPCQKRRRIFATVFIVSPHQKGVAFLRQFSSSVCTKKVSHFCDSFCQFLWCEILFSVYGRLPQVRTGPLPQEVRTFRTHLANLFSISMSPRATPTGSLLILLNRSTCRGNPDFLL